MGSQRSRYSAPTLAARNDCGVRLRVERNSFPPGASSAASVARKAAGSGTCSITSSAVMIGKRVGSAQQVLGHAGPIGERQSLAGSMGARRLDCPAGGIQAQDVEPQASESLRRQPRTAPDVEQPWNSLPLREGAGGRGLCRPSIPLPPTPSRKGRGRLCALFCALCSAHRPSRLIRSAIHATRVGFIRCSGRIGPSGSHHRAASASNCATSAGETVTLGMVAPVVPRQYEHPGSTTDNWLECRES